MQAFLKSFNAQQSQLSVKDFSSRIGSVKKLVRKYFFPSTDSKATAEEEFNYELYTHFKAYNEILVEKMKALSLVDETFGEITEEDDIAAVLLDLWSCEN